jgi:SAM-dependent methyltransferase
MAAVEDRHWWYGGMRAIAAAMLEGVFAGRHDLEILDAGCGTGGNVQFLGRYGHVVGIDLAPEAACLGQGRLPGQIVRGSVLDLPFADSRFDLVTSFDVLYHRGVPDEVAALREAARVLRPAGYVLVRVPALEVLRGKHDRAVHTRRRYTEAEACAMVANAGFAVERCSYANTLLFPLPLAQRMIERSVPRLEQRAQSDLALPSPVVNEILRWPLAAEAAWLSRGHRFPIGVSVVVLARRV